MTAPVAVAGKGGSGKTSLASLIIRYLMKKDKGPILAVDADPNAKLGRRRKPLPRYLEGLDL